jgi:hypothetical protein
MKKRRRFQEGGDIPDIDREPLRDSSGEIVRSSSGEAVMSGGADKDRAMGMAMREARDAEALDAAMMRRPSVSKPVAEAKPIVTRPRIEAIGDTDLAEPSTAGFNRAPIKMPSKSATKPAVKQPLLKAQVKQPEKRSVKAEPAKRESMFSTKGASVKDITRGMMKRPEGYAKGGKVSSASKRADGIATKGKTRGKYI